VERDERPAGARGRGARIARGVVYWLAVFAISIAILVGLILLLESRDQSSLDESRAPSGGVAVGALAHG
jgi:hypothetical protein